MESLLVCTLVALLLMCIGATAVAWLPEDEPDEGPVVLHLDD